MPGKRRATLTTIEGAAVHLDQPVAVAEFQRGSAVRSARKSHNLQVAGSNPAPATTSPHLRFKQDTARIRAEIDAEKQNGAHHHEPDRAAPPTPRARRGVGTYSDGRGLETVPAPACEPSPVDPGRAGANLSRVSDEALIAFVAGKAEGAARSDITTALKITKTLVWRRLVELKRAGKVHAFGNGSGVRWFAGPETPASAARWDRIRARALDDRRQPWYQARLERQRAESAERMRKGLPRSSRGRVKTGPSEESVEAAIDAIGKRVGCAFKQILTHFGCTKSILSDRLKFLRERNLAHRRGIFWYTGPMREETAQFHRARIAHAIRDYEDRRLAKQRAARAAQRPQNHGFNRYCGPAVHVNPAEMRAAIDKFIAEKGVTKCPTAYVAPVTGAAPVAPVPSYDKLVQELSKKEARRRVRARWFGRRQGQFIMPTMVDQRKAAHRGGGKGSKVGRARADVLAAATKL